MRQGISREPNRPAMPELPNYEPDDHLARLLAPDTEEPWYKSVYRNIQEMIHPPKLPPLEVTSKPVAVKDIWGLYNRDNRSIGASLGLQIGVVALLFTVFSQHAAITQAVKDTVHILDPNLEAYKPKLPPKAQTAQGGGGGGAKAPLPVAKGELPKRALKQFIPPSVVVNQAPKLPVVPTIVSDVPLPNVKMDNYGDPLAKLGIPSNGSGSGNGMGNGSGGGVGSGKGAGYGPGEGGGVGGGVYRVGGGVSAPTVLFKVDPEYSEEARKAKYSGTVLIQLIVGPDGHATGIRVVRSLGLGLDEKAMEAVAKWKFKPGTKSGQPVAVQATIEVNFRLL
jgi:protein TonB